MNILLVDDNIYILEGLRAGIDYQKLGFDKVFEARSMDGAIRILKEHPVEVILTDIEMPNGSGLDLLEWINHNKPEAVTLFCTSYANFDYAKKAVELHSFDYYLKPIQYEELDSILERAVIEVKNREAQREKSLMGEYWLRNLDENKNHFWEEALFRIFAYSEEELEELAQTRQLKYKNSDCFTIGILQFLQEESKIEALSYSIQQFVMRNILEELFGQKEIGVEGLLKSDHEVWTFILTGKQDVTKEQYHQIFEKFISDSMKLLNCPATIGYQYHQPLSEIRSRYLELEEVFIGHSLEENQIYHYPELDKSMEREDTEDGDSVVEKVKAYIDSHYDEDITRESMASSVYHNSAYLARIFKKKTGQSLGSYLMDKRIDRAKQLLMETDWSVSQVALEVGYDNFAYFSRLFKKKTGYTPKDYKKVRNCSPKE